jgi:hypothetical protein
VPYVYPENLEGTREIVGSMNMGYVSDTVRNRTHNLFHSKCASIPLGHCDGLWVPMRPRWWSWRRLTIGTYVIQPADVVRDLGVYFDSHLTVKAYESLCFYYLCRLRSMRHSLELTSPHGLFPPLWSCGWITATRYWHIYRLLRWHRSRESSMLLPGCSWIWDHVITCDRRSLVANCRENQVQTLPLGIPCDQWSSTVIFDWTGHLCGQRPRSSFSPFRMKEWSGRSAIKIGFVRAGVSCCGTKSLEQPASRL